MVQAACLFLGLVGVLFLLAVYAVNRPEFGAYYPLFVQHVLSWPVVGSVVVVAALMRFGGSLEAFLNRVRSASAAGVTLTAQVPEDREMSEAAQRIVGQLIDATLEYQGRLLAAEQTAASREQELRTWVMLALYWEFKYLVYFLVPYTKLVLHWFAQFSSPIARDAFHDVLARDKKPETERNAILDVLLEHGLVREDMTGLCITDKGRQFLRFAGFLPEQ